LNVPLHNVLGVSAQKALVAKVTQDAALLAASQLSSLEQALAEGIIGQRQAILRTAVVSAVAELRGEASRMLVIRRRDLAEQAMELRGLGGKNAGVIRHLKSRIDQERQEFEQSGSKIHAVKSVHMRLLKDVFRMLGGKTLADEMSQLLDALDKTGIKFGVKRAYEETFERLRLGFDNVQTSTTEIQTMLTASFRQMNAEFGFTLQPPPELDLGRFKTELEGIERSHYQYVGVGNALKLARADTANRLVRALKSRLRIVYETALSELEMWSKSATSQLDAQLLERHRNYSRRLDAVERVQSAAGDLSERLAEIDSAQKVLQDQDEKLLVLTTDLLNAGNVKSRDIDSAYAPLGEAVSGFGGEAVSEPAMLQAA
jgi:hypothetical protein